MKNTFFASVFLLSVFLLTSCGDDEGDKIACQTEISQKMESDLAAEDAAMQHRLDTETLTSAQENAIRSASLSRKATIRNAAAANMERCD